jgi:hypothetical protein
MSSLIKAWLAGFVTVFVISFVWYTVLLAKQYEAWEANVARESELLWSIIAGLAVITLLMAYMYPRGYEGGPPLMEGLRFGALIGLIVGAGTGLIVYGAWAVQAAGVIADAVLNLVAFALAGAAIGWAYGANPKGAM